MLSHTLGSAYLFERVGKIMNIRPSTKLKVVSVSKLKTLTCLRKYFWRYVMNLESTKLNDSFWYGGVYGAGLEATLSGKNTKQVKTAMKKEDKSRRLGYVIDHDLNQELNLQFQLIEAFILGIKKTQEFKRIEMTKSQIKFRLPLKESGLLFCGTLDGAGTHNKQKCMLEGKAVSNPSRIYIESLRFGMQTNGYAWAHKEHFTKCVCCIHAKTKKYVKKNQTPDEFVQEIKDCISGKILNPKTKKPYVFYHWHSFNFGRTTVSETGADIEGLAYYLSELYSMNSDDLLNPLNWPKQREVCSNWKGCEYFLLCKNLLKWKVYLQSLQYPLFKQRTMLYEEEKEELE